jgi:two-component system chemotaxis response regulator CheY
MALGDPKMKILVVDDFSTMRRIVKTLLRQNGYSNFIEADSHKANEVLDANPDVEFIVADWKMADGKGMDFLKSVRGDPKYKNLPFLMVTAEADKSETSTALKKFQRSAFIVKPFTGQSLNEKLNKTFTPSKAKKIS